MGIENHGENNALRIHPKALVRNATIAVHGNNNLIRVGPDTDLRNSTIDIRGDNNIFDIASRCRVQITVKFISNSACFRMGEGTTVIGAGIGLHENRKIEIGKDCMLSDNIWIRDSDNHNIIDLDTGLRINAGRDIVIGDHVWIGMRVMVMKGTRIGTGAVIGAGAVVTKTIPDNCIAAGNPARVIRENVSWERRNTRTNEPEVSGNPAIKMHASVEGDLYIE